jgi:hypothetical protein
MGESSNPQTRNQRGAITPEIVWRHTPKTMWRLYAGNPVAPLRRK